MKAANLLVTWAPSPSTDVINYKVVVINEDTQGILLETTVSAAQTEVRVEAVPELTSLTATVVANDGTYDSDPVSESFLVGDLSKPLPVGFVTISLEEVVDVTE